MNNSQDSVFNNLAEEVREATDSSHTHDECDSGESLIPLGIGELAVMLVLNGTEEEFSNDTEDIHRSDYNRAASDDCEYTVEHIGVLE